MQSIISHFKKNTVKTIMLLSCCGMFANDDDEIESITNSYEGTIHSYTRQVFRDTNFEEMLQFPINTPVY